MKIFKSIKNLFTNFYLDQRGVMGINKLIGVVVMFVVIGTIVAALWSTFVGTDTAIQALTETDDATVLLQALWPIALLVAGVFFVWRVIKSASS